MRTLSSRLGVLPALVVGAGLVAIGLVVLDWLLNTVWPISPFLTDAQYLEVQRGIAEDRFNAATLLQIVNAEAVALFLVAVGFVAMGAMMPLAYFINRRVQSWLQTRDARHFAAETGRARRAEPTPPTPLFVLLRQGFWFGIWVAFCFWLQMNRTFGLAVVLLVATVLILVELLLLMRALAAQRPAPAMAGRSNA